MGKEVTMRECGDGEDASGDEDRVLEWDIGLPSGDDLTSLSQSLVPSVLALAFSIIPERRRKIEDVNRASQNMLSSLRSNGSSGGANVSSSNTAVSVEEVDREGSSSLGSDSKKQKKSDGYEAVDSIADEGDSVTEDPSGKALKRPRLVWTPQLHMRFVEVVAHLGVKNAVPKTIMQLMNVEGLTRENVASHLQKYRLYLKRNQGLVTEGQSSSDQLFSSTPVPPHRFQNGGSSIDPANEETGKLGIPISVPSMMPMPVYGQHMGMQGYHHNSHGYNQYHHHSNSVFESNPYLMQQNKFGSMGTSSSVGGRGVSDK